MKIVLVGPAYPFRGGIAQHGQVLCQKLTNAGHDALMVSFKKQFPRLIFPGKTQIDPSQERLPVKTYPTFAPLNPLSWWKSYRKIKKEKPDVVLFNWFTPFFAPGFWAVSWLVRWGTKARIIYLLHNVIPHENLPCSRFLTRLALRTADAYVTHAQAVKQDLLKWLPKVKPEQIEVSPLPLFECFELFSGTMQEARRALKVKESKVLLFFGIVREYKGLQFLLLAMKEIVRRLQQDVHLLVVGEFYKDRTEYDNLIRDLDIGDYITIHDEYIPNEDVGRYFAAADVAVLPYKSATQSAIIQTAYHLECPVITTDVGGLGEVVEEGVTGFVVPPENPSAIAEAVETFFARGGRAAMREGILKERGKYSWEGMVEIIEKSAKKSR
ncbi:glycosyltransferase [bacterium]|nr:glycosyltransferase [bacterium]